MERGKQLLGFALLGTGVWLVGILGSLAGVDGVVRLLAFLVVVALAAWSWGAWRRGGVLAAGLVLVLATGWGALRFSPAAPMPTAGREAWSEEAVARSLAQGRPVLVDFTADWCLSCKFNERTVLASEQVQSALARTRTQLLVADWTRRDPAIARRLAAHGRAGVPMYLVYSPARPDQPEVLPELLTLDIVVSALERAAPAPGALGLSSPPR
jgi:thiol:disulfide interchange protein DsbD